MADIEKLPPRLEITDTESWKDDKGSPYEITIRGERTVDGIYFRVTDIANVFEMKNLETTILKKTTGYERFIHYKFFLYHPKGKNVIKKVRKALYLTFAGLTRVLFVSKVNNKILSFQKNYLSMIFADAFGNNNDKITVASNLLGIDVKVMKKVLGTSVKKIACVYLFTIGTVSELRKSMNIDKSYSDSMIVCKFGMTVDLLRRTYEHTGTYKDIKNSNLRLKYYGPIDTKNIKKAEDDLKEFFSDHHLDYDNTKELVIIDNSFINNKTKKFYQKTVSKYNTELKNVEITEVKHENEVLKCQNIILQKDKEIAELKNLLLKNGIDVDKQKGSSGSKSSKNK